MGQFSYAWPVTRVPTDVPGAVVEVVELDGGLRVELNGAGSVVAHLYPMGLEDDGDWDDDDWESPQDRVKRLTAELKEARKALPDKAVSA